MYIMVKVAYDTTFTYFVQKFT